MAGSSQRIGIEAAIHLPFTKIAVRTTLESIIRIAATAYYYGVQGQSFERRSQRLPRVGRAGPKQIGYRNSRFEPA